jgi:hypothetical protein
MEPAVSEKLKNGLSTCHFHPSYEDASVLTKGCRVDSQVNGYSMSTMALSAKSISTNFRRQTGPPTCIRKIMINLG